MNSRGTSSQSSTYFDANEISFRDDDDNDLFHSVRQFSSAKTIDDGESFVSNLSSNNLKSTKCAASIDVTSKNTHISNIDDTATADNISTVTNSKDITSTPNAKNNSNQEPNMNVASASKKIEESQYLESMTLPSLPSIISDSSSPLEKGVLRDSAKPFFKTMISTAEIDVAEKKELIIEESSNVPSPSIQQIPSSLSKEESDTDDIYNNDEKYLACDKDTGEKFDIRDLERYSSKESNAGYEVVCSLFKSKVDLIQQQELSKSNISSPSSTESEKSELTAQTSITSKREKFKQIMKKGLPIKPESLSTNLIKKGEKTKTVSSTDSSNIDELEVKNPKGSLKGKILKRFSKSDNDEIPTTLPKEDNSNCSDDEKNKVSKQSSRKINRKIRSFDVSVGSSTLPTTGINLRKNTGRKQLNQQFPGNAIPVKCHSKSASDSDFHPMLMIQAINKAHEGAIWSMSLSNAGKSSQYYLATGGQDTVVLLWKLASSIQPTPSNHPKMNSPFQEEENEEQTQPPVSPWTGPSLGDEVQIIESSSFDQKPFRRLIGHEADVVDLSWSFTQFLLSASLDKTVRLWHPTRNCCLHIFRHADMVTCVDFHPFQDKYFVSGGYDKKLRIWSIPDGRVSEWAQTANIITTSKYTPNGEYVIAGLYEGQVVFYSTTGSLKYYTQITCKNRSEKKGKKVTGICFLQGASPIVSDIDISTEDDPHKGGNETDGGSGNLSDINKTKQHQTPSRSDTKSQSNRTPIRKSMAVLSPLLVSAASKLGSNRFRHRIKEQMLITTNDSRLRLFGLNDYCMVRKYKGGKNSSMQIRARFSESGEFIVCGSDTGHVHLWNTATQYNPLRLNVGGIHNYDKTKAIESFEATRAEPQIITATLFMPAECVKNAFLSSGLFPTLSSLDHIDHDMSSAAIVTADYEGTIRVFLRKTCIDNVIHSAGPAGLHP